jgi:methylated-DNA-protein-cysteine methyltransferase-like protein
MPPVDPPDAPRPPGAALEPPHRLTPFQQHVAEVVAALRPGEVLTYGEVALEAGHPGAAQAVANVLRRLPDLPWWRVVPASGRLYRTHAPIQQPLLEADGVTVDAERHVLR